MCYECRFLLIKIFVTIKKRILGKSHVKLSYVCFLLQALCISLIFFGFDVGSWWIGISIDVHNNIQSQDENLYTISLYGLLGCIELIYMIYYCYGHVNFRYFKIYNSFYLLGNVSIEIIGTPNLWP